MDQRRLSGHGPVARVDAGGPRAARPRRSSARSSGSSSRPRSPTSRPRPTRSCADAHRRGPGRRLPRRSADAEDEAADRRPPRPRPVAATTGAAAERRRGRARRRTPPRTPRPPDADGRADGRAARYPAAVPDRLPPPGPSFLREQPIRIGDRTLSGRHGPAVRGARRLVAGGRVGHRRRRRRQLPRRRAGRRAAARPAAGATRPGVSGALSGLILEDAGRLQMRLGLIAPPDDPSRPWRAPAGASAPPSGSSPRGRPRCARTSSPRRSSAGFVRAIERAPPALIRSGRVDSRTRCATCSTTSWKSCASARPIARGEDAARPASRTATLRTTTRTPDDDGRRRGRRTPTDGDDRRPTRTTPTRRGRRRPHRSRSTSARRRGASAPAARTGRAG